MLSCNHLILFLELIENYKEQSLKKYTLNFKNKLSSKIQNTIRMAASITNDNDKQIFNDDFITKKEYDFLYLIAIEQQNRTAIEIISDSMPE